MEESARPADQRSDAVAFLAQNLAYELHLRFLAALEATARGDDAGASMAYLEASGRARQLLLEAGYATDADVLDAEWDRVLLQAARRVVGNAADGADRS